VPKFTIELIKWAPGLFAVLIIIISGSLPQYQQKE
jgi:hypothetical protein